MLSFLLKFCFTHRAQRQLAHASICIFLFISWILLLFLALSCLDSLSSLSDIYLIQAKNSNTVTRTGYFHMCSKPQRNSSFTCAGIEKFKENNGLPYVFAKHVSRPYFLGLSLAVTLVSLIMAVVRIFVRQLNEYHLPWFWLTFIFCMVTAIWQQVAVQAASHLIPDDVEHGTRAGAMIWSAFAFIILAIIIELAVLQRQDNDENGEMTSKNGEDSIMSTIYKVGDGVQGL